MLFRRTVIYFLFWISGVSLAAEEEKEFAPAELPPALSWSGASETLIVDRDHPWITPAEEMGLEDSPNYPNTIAYLRRLCTASELLDLTEFGRTPEGRDLYVVIARSTEVGSGKPVVLAQAGIHSGEIDGKDAGLMLLRDIAFGGKDDLLRNVDFLFVPVFNVDGHERRSRFNRPNQRGPEIQGWRTSAQNLNLNRDYLKADTPEMQAMLGLINEWDPALYLDLHVTDGIDYQYDITFGYNGYDGGQAWSPSIGAWLDAVLRPAATFALRAKGHIPGRLVFAQDDRDPAKGIGLGSTMPRFSDGYGDLRHMPSILVENHSLKSYRQRVLGTYVFLEAVLQCVGENADSLRQAISEDRAARPGVVPVNWSMEGEERRIEFLGVTYEEFESLITGETEVRWLGEPVMIEDTPLQIGAIGATVERPVAYWIPASCSMVIERLRIHGVEMDTLEKPRSLEVDMHRLVDPKSASKPYEGWHRVTTQTTLETRIENFPAGSVRASTDQPLGELVIVALEPSSPASFLKWGFFPGILQRTEYIEGYVIDPLATRMIEDDPRLEADFEAALADDPEFAGDREARLRWFYERTPYYDDRYLLYPVGVER